MAYTTEQKIEAIELVVHQKMSYREVKRTTGISHETVRRWHHQFEKNPQSLYSASCVKVAKREDEVMDLENLPDDPDELKKIIFDMQFEADLKEAIVDILKKDPGVHWMNLKNKEKALLVDALMKKKTYSIGWILLSLQLAPATFYYHRKRMGADPEEKLRAKVIEVSAKHPEHGYRRIKHALDVEDSGFAHISEKRIRRIMKEEGIQPPRRRKNSRYSSYDSRLDKGQNIPNIPLKEDGTHDFVADVPNALWVSDVTEFHLPNDARIYLSPVLDCFDSSLRSWKISTSQKAEDLTNPSLLDAAKKLKTGETPVAHTDRGGPYFSQGWIDICEKFNITRSMSRKGHSPDNARMEGFFGRLKIEFFDTRDWRGVSTQDFFAALDEWLCYYNEDRAKQSLGWLSPMQYRGEFLQAA